MAAAAITRNITLEAQGFTELPAAVLVGDLGYIGAAVEEGVAGTIGS